MAQDIAYQSATGRGNVPVSESRPLPVEILALTSGTLTKSTVTMSGASGVLVAADATRAIVIVSSTSGNASAAIDITGGTCALDSGIQIAGGDTIQIVGREAQSAMTQIGTTTQKLTVYTGS